MSDISQDVEARVELDSFTECDPPGAGGEAEVNWVWTFFNHFTASTGAGVGAAPSPSRNLYLLTCVVEGCNFAVLFDSKDEEEVRKPTVRDFSVSPALASLVCTVVQSMRRSSPPLAPESPTRKVGCCPVMKSLSSRGTSYA